jgi:hypothetical protein
MQIQNRPSFRVIAEWVSHLHLVGNAFDPLGYLGGGSPRECYQQGPPRIGAIDD